MKKLFACVALVLAAGSAAPSVAQGPGPAPAMPVQPDAGNLAIAQEIVALAYPAESRQAMFMRFTDSLAAQMRGAIFPETGGPADAGLQAIMERYLARVRVITQQTISEGTPALFDAYARAYARQFSREDLVQIQLNEQLIVELYSK